MGCISEVRGSEYGPIDEIEVVDSKANIVVIVPITTLIS